MFKKLILAHFLLYFSIVHAQVATVDKSLKGLYDDTITVNINDLTNLIGQELSIEKVKKIRSVSQDFMPIALKTNLATINRIIADRPLKGDLLTKLHLNISNFIKLQNVFKYAMKSEVLEVRLLAGLDRLDLFLKLYRNPYLVRKFRRLVNDADRSFDLKGQSINKVINRLLSRKTIMAIIEDFNNYADLYNENKTNFSDEFAQIIKKHSAVNLLKQYKDLFKLRSQYQTRETIDYIADIKDEIIHQLSGAFGNAVGAIRWRKGWLLKRKEILDEIYKTIRPLDIITEKTYFALTDTFIPGHFGHNAIWLGTKDQLIEIGMWFHPSIIPFHADIEQGKSIIETDRTGTHLKSLEDFMNVDEFAILRFKEDYFTGEKIEMIYDVALAQIGKTYDFNFDVETTDQLVCSELLYQSFGDVEWPTEPYIGRITISPDNIASLALYRNSPLDLVYFVAEKKEGELIYKTKEDLAKDIDIELINDSYFSVRKECRRSWDGVSYYRTAGSKIRRRKYERDCIEIREVLVYE